MSRILVVAPVELRRRFVDILRNAGYFVTEADSGDRAISIASSLSPTLVLMAIVMQKGNGLETAAQLRRIPELYQLPIILLGSVTPIGIDDEPLVSMVNGYLDVQVPEADLLMTVDRQLSINHKNISH